MEGSKGPAQENPGSRQLWLDFAKGLNKAEEEPILNCEIEVTSQLFLLFGVSDIKPIF